MKNMGTEEFQNDMKNFETLLKKLRAEFNQHLVGNLKFPPEFTIASARKMIRKYAMDRTLRGMQRFQYFNLVAKFNTMLEFYNRRLRDKEQGRQTTFRIVKEGANPELDAARKKIHDQEESRIDKGHIIANVQRQQTTIRKMFDTWSEYASQVESPPEMDFNKFKIVIAQKTDQLIEQKHCKAIRYKLMIKDGKIKIQAKPIK